MSGKVRVVVTLQGGLGNQLFQYGAGLLLAREHGAEVVFRDRNEGVDLSGLLGVELCQASISDLRQLALYEPSGRSLRSVWFHRVREQRLRRSLRDQRLVQSDAYAPRALGEIREQARLVGLEGYFQHPSWFEPALADIVGLLDQAISRCASPSLGAAATVVSFRRGDYIRAGWALDADYYERALASLPRSDGPVWVISDDELLPAVAGSWLRGKGFAVEALPDLGVGGRLRDLALLARADRVVMSNSTFCWWGVVAGEASSNRGGEQKIVAPREWIPSMPTSRALLRDHWTLT